MTPNRISRRGHWLGAAAAVLYFAGPVAAQAPAEESQVKAAFVYNFLKFVDWPASAFGAPADSLIVAIVGDGATADAAAAFLQGKQVNERAIAVRRLKEDAALPPAHAVFVGDASPGQLRRVLEAASGAGALSIGEADEFAAQGGVIGLLVEARRVRFEINTAAADAARLRISSKLLALARIVIPRTTDGAGR